MQLPNNVDDDSEQDIVDIQKEFESMWAEAIADAAPDDDSPPHIEKDVSLARFWIALFCIFGIAYALLSSEGDSFMLFLMHVANIMFFLKKIKDILFSSCWQPTSYYLLVTFCRISRGFRPSQDFHWDIFLSFCSF
jgi:hypothetical protein